MTESAQVGALSSIVRELGLPSTLLSPLLAHAESVRADADRLGLVSVADLDSIVPRHTADSLLIALARAPEPEECWVDVGSGAGFPGLVLGIAYPQTSFTLSEPQSRRAGFLDLQVARLGLSNVQVWPKRAQQLEHNFDVAVARAFADPPVALDVLCALAPEGDAILAVGGSARSLEGVRELDVSRAGVDSPGRIFMIAGSSEGA